MPFPRLSFDPKGEPCGVKGHIKKSIARARYTILGSRLFPHDAVGVFLVLACRGAQVCLTEDSLRQQELPGPELWSLRLYTPDTIPSLSSVNRVLPRGTPEPR